MNETVEMKCEFCNKTFKLEKSFDVHVCKKKQRWMDRDLHSNRIGFSAWHNFMRRYHSSSTKHHDYRNFIDTSFYSAFVKFGDYCIKTGVINAQAYADWLLKNNVKIDYWCSDKQYNKYLIEYLKTESPYVAIERSMETIIDRAKLDNIHVKDVFEYLNINRLCSDITMGRISPWLLYNCNSANKLWERLDEQQLMVIYPYIDNDSWRPKFLRDRETVDDIKNILKQAGL